MKAKNKIALSLIGAAMLTALVVAASFSAFRRIEEAADARRHTSAVIHSADVVMSELRDAETGQRGYLLTGDEAFLNPYLAVRDSIVIHFEQMRSAVSIKDVKAHLDVMRPLVEGKLAELARLVDLRRRTNMSAAIAAVRSGRGQRLMDSIRVEMIIAIGMEERALAQRETEFQSDMNNLFRAIVVASLFTLLLALLFAYLVYRDSQHRLKDQVHLETEHLLKIQEETNRQLQQTNATLQISEEKFAVTLTSIGDAVIATDAEGCVNFLNPLAEQLTGWTQASAAGLPVEKIFHIISQETRQPSVIPVKEALAHGTKQSLVNHTVLIALDGSECAIADTCTPIRNRNGEVVGAVLVFRDVTEENAAQLALREKSVELEKSKFAAEKANLAKSDFLSSMSHELRSPLNAILGFAQLMDSDVPPATPSQKESINRILHAGWYLLELINEILDLAVVESGKMSLSHEPVSLSEVISECHAIIEPQGLKRGVSLIFPRLDVPLFVMADRTRLKQILINILSNAVKYNRKGGSVEVKCAEVAAGRLRISIRDTGAGLTPEKITQLFEPFNRLGQETSAEEGTGIGLVMSKRLAELMKGEIGVESYRGGGKRFLVRTRNCVSTAAQNSGGRI